MNDGVVKQELAPVLCPKMFLGGPKKFYRAGANATGDLTNRHGRNA